MGQIFVYDTTTAEHQIVNANGKLKDIFPEINFEHSIILKAGNRITSDYEVTDEDVLYIRKTPAAISTTTATIIAVTTAIIAVIAVGVAVGTAIYSAKKSKEAMKQMEEAQKKAKDLADSFSQSPFIRGAKNQKALGNTVQFLMGRNVYNTPYNLTDGFYSLRTDGWYYNAVFSAGYGPQRITQVLLGEEVLKKVNTDEGMNGEYTISSSKYSGTVEVRQPGNNMSLPNCNYKVVSNNALTELKDGEEIILQMATNAKKIQVAFEFPVLRSYSDKGNWEKCECDIGLWWSNGGSWNRIDIPGTTNGHLFDKNAKNVRSVATYEFSASESYGKKISIKMLKTPYKNKYKNRQDTCLLMWYQTFCYDAETSTSSSLNYCHVENTEQNNKITKVAYRIKADASTEAILDELHVIGDGYAHIKTSSTDWNGAKKTTDNPASWLVEVLTSDLHPSSKISLEELYLPSFTALYNYCNTNQFYCNGIVTESIKKRDLIQKILSICNATLIINKDGLYEVCIDKEEQNPVALLNSENIVSMTYAKSLQRKVDGSKITYIDNRTWKVDTFYAMLDGGSYDYVNDKVTDFSPEFVTTYEHAHRLALRRLKEMQLMPTTIEVDVGSEGDYYPLYGTILLQLPQLLQGLRSSVIKTLYFNSAHKLAQIEISDAVDFVSGSRYGVIIQATNEYGYRLISAEVQGTGKTRLLLFTEPIDLSSSDIIPIVGNHLSFGLLDSEGNFGKITSTMKIYGIKPNNKNGYVLTLKNYNPEVYSFDENIPEYKSNITLPQEIPGDSELASVTQLRQTITDLQGELMNAKKLVELPVVVDASLKDVAFDVQSGLTVGTQVFETKIICRQGDRDMVFQIGTINVPSGWSYQVLDGKVIFRIAEGTPLNQGIINIPVICKPGVTFDIYADENDNAYVDENEDDYFISDPTEESYTYYVQVAYIATNLGIYRGKINSLAELPTNCRTNDFFLWAGVTTDSELSIEGKFKKARLYKYIGNLNVWQWEIDTDMLHTQLAFSDIMSLADTDLQNNNSTAWEYLDHLTSNSIFTDLLIANSAFIEDLKSEIIDVENLFVSEAVVKEKGIIRSDNYNGTINSNGEITANGTVGWAIDHNGRADFSNVNVTGTFSGRSSGVSERIALKTKGSMEGVSVTSFAELRTELLARINEYYWLEKNIDCVGLLVLQFRKEIVSLNIQAIHSNGLGNFSIFGSVNYIRLLATPDSTLNTTYLESPDGDYSMWESTSEFPFYQFEFILQSSLDNDHHNTLILQSLERSAYGISDCPRFKGCLLFI